MSEYRLITVEPSALLGKERDDSAQLEHLVEPGGFFQGNTVGSPAN